MYYQQRLGYITLGALSRQIRRGDNIHAVLISGHSLRVGSAVSLAQVGGFGRGDAVGGQMGISTGGDSSGISIASDPAHYTRA